MAGIYQNNPTLRKLGSFNPSYSPSGSNTSNSMSFLGSALGGLGSAIGSFTSYKAQKKALKQQQKQFEEQMAFSERWNQTNFDNENKWRQYDYDWNTMSAQRKRIEEAGMNPALMMGQMSPGFSSSQAAGTGDLSAPHSYTPIVADALGNGLQNLAGNITQTMLTLSQKEKLDAESQDIRTMMYEKWRGLNLENDTKELNLALDKIYAVSERNQKVRNMTAEYAKMVAEKVAAYAQGRYYDESALNQFEQSLLNKAKTNLTNEEYRQFVELFPLVKQKENETIKLLKKQQATEDSQQAANYASANASNATAENQREQAETQRREQFHIDSLRKKTDAERGKIIESAISMYEDSEGVKFDSNKRAQIRDVLWKSMKEELKQKEKQTRQQGSDYWNPFNYIGKALGGGASISKVIK